MKELWRIAQREITVGKRLLWLAAALGVLVPLAVAPTRYYPDVVALVLALALSHGVALLTGAAMLHGPLREGRLGFYFSRPISEAGLWWGKWLGNSALVVLVKTAVLLPAVVWTTMQGTTVGDLLRISALSTALLPLSVLAGHAVAALLSAPGLGRWVNVTVALVAFSFITWCLGLLGDANAAGARYSLAVLAATALVVGVIVGGWQQVRHGRVEAVRGHRAFSRSLWGAVGAVALLGSGFTHWVLNLDPDRMAMARFEAGSQTPWFAATFEGTALQNGVSALLLVHAENGDWHELGRNPGARLPARLSVDGRRAIWTSHIFGPNSLQLDGWFAERQEDGSFATKALPDWLHLGQIGAWELSPSGSRVLDVHYRRPRSRRKELDVRVRVWDVDSETVLMEKWFTVPRLSSNWTPSTRAFWDSETAARLYLVGRDLTLWSVDLKAQAVEKEASVAVGDDGSPIFVSPPSKAAAAARREVRTVGGGVAMVRFSEGGQRVLVGGRLPGKFDGAKRADGSASSSTPRIDGWRSDETYFSLYDAALEGPLWTLEPLTETVTSLQLADDHAFVLTVPQFGFAPSRTNQPRMHVGGEGGWKVRDVPSWGFMGSLEDETVLARHLEGFSAQLVGDRIVRLPEQLAALEPGYVSVGLVSSDSLWSARGGELTSPEIERVLYREVHDDRRWRIHSSLLRYDPRDAAVEPLFSTPKND
ncbi:MAG: hypothetical protein AAF690_22060 [Acidobacteriota bacterium]